MRAASLLAFSAWLLLALWGHGQTPIESWPPLDVESWRLASAAVDPVAAPTVPESIELELPHVEGVPTPEPTAPLDSPPAEGLFPWMSGTWPASPLASGWEGGMEVGINATQGNAEAFSFRTGGNLKRKIEPWELTANVIYAKATANQIESQHNAIFNSGYERTLGETRWSHFGKLNLEYDEFKAFDVRLAMNAGLSYMLLRTTATTLKGRFGSGISHELGGPDDRWVPEAVFGGDFNHQLSSRQKLAVTWDYFPEWTEFTNFRAVTDVSWQLALDEASKLSLKLSLNDRYDSTPHGRKPNDVIYAFLLIWQL